MIYTCRSVRVYTPRETLLLQDFTVVAHWSVRAGWCAGVDGCGDKLRNANPGMVRKCPRSLYISLAYEVMTTKQDTSDIYEYEYVYKRYVNHDYGDIKIRPRLLGLLYVYISRAVRVDYQATGAGNRKVSRAYSTELRFASCIVGAQACQQHHARERTKPRRTMVTPRRFTDLPMALYSLRHFLSFTSAGYMVNGAMAVVVHSI